VIYTRNLRRPDQGKGHPFLVLFLLVLFLLTVIPSLAANRAQAVSDQQARIAVSVNLVVLPVKVTDGRGIFLPGLKLEDFRVYEDGELQTISVFEEGDTPVTVGLVVDHSRSMAPKLREVAAAVTGFAHSSNPQDEMFVVDFNDTVSIELMKGKVFSSDAKELEGALNAVTALGRTALYDAVSEGFNHLQGGHWGKKALIIISDGGDNASHLKYSQLLAQARKSQSIVYSIGLVGSDEEEENPRLLRRLCKDTGGIAYFPGKGESVGKVSLEIARDLREQYTLGYVPKQMKQSRGYRKTEVKVVATDRGRLHVRSRPGYSPATQDQATSPTGPGTR
jgi:Ca-activated chloride channel family protein